MYWGSGSSGSGGGQGEFALRPLRQCVGASSGKGDELIPRPLDDICRYLWWWLEVGRACPKAPDGVHRCLLW